MRKWTSSTSYFLCLQVTFKLSVCVLRIRYGFSYHIIDSKSFISKMFTKVPVCFSEVDIIISLNIHCFFIFYATVRLISAWFGEHDLRKYDWLVLEITCGSFFFGLFSPFFCGWV